MQHMNNAKSKHHRVRVPSCEQIAAAQCLIVANLPNVEPDLAASSCWACGFYTEDFKPYRAHIVAHAAGGDTSEPTNYFLLCETCHREQPDGAGLAAQLLWLVGHKTWGLAVKERWQPIIDAAMVIVRERDVPHDVFARWCDAELPKAARNFNKPGYGFTNGLPTARAIIIDAFVAWLDAQEAT